MSEPDNPIHEHPEYPAPPATFEFLTLSMKTQTEMCLGLLHFGEEKDRPKADLRAARHLIDVLAMLQDKTKGNLSFEEQRLLENAITELRFRYVQVLEHAGRTQAGGTEAETA
jgi:hypothetical protein